MIKTKNFNNKSRIATYLILEDFLESYTNTGTIKKNPDINWISLGKSLGVESFTCLTIEDFRKVFSSTVKEAGPSLIEVRF